MDPNSHQIDVVVERSHVIKEEFEVKWKLVSNERFHLSNGTIFFNEENVQKVIKLDLKNADRNISTRIELFEPSNGFQLGEHKVAKITFSCKMLFNIIP